MTEFDVLKERIMELVATSENQRVRPIDAIQTLIRELGTSRHAVNEAVRGLVEDGELVYTYRDPCSYVEIPRNVS